MAKIMPELQSGKCIVVGQKMERMDSKYTIEYSKKSNMGFTLKKGGVRLSNGSQIKFKNKTLHYITVDIFYTNNIDDRRYRRTLLVEPKQKLFTTIQTDWKRPILNVYFMIPSN